MSEEQQATDRRSTPAPSSAVGARAAATGDRSRSGLDYLRGVIDGRMPPPPIAGVAGIEILSAEPGEVVLQSIPDHAWLNPNGHIHGGWMCTMLDSAMGLAVTSALDSMTVAYSSIELKVSFLKPVVLDGRPVVVRGTTLRVGRRVAFAEARAHDGNGALIGHATSSLARVS